MTTRKQFAVLAFLLRPSFAISLLQKSTPATSVNVQQISRSTFFKSIAAASTAILTATTTTKTTILPALAVGPGPRKTKPDTGVVLISEPLENNAGLVSAEIFVPPNIPVRIAFTTPWSLLATTSGLEAREIQQPESAFVQVVSEQFLPHSTEQARDLIVASVLGQRGKFGAYGTPFDVKVKAVNDKANNVYDVSFTALTPGMRESERRVFIKMVPVGETNLVLLVAGTTKQRFVEYLPTLQAVIESFEVIPGPATRLR